MDRWSRPSIVALLGIAATGAQAHHSYAMFDMHKSLAVEGSIAKFEWTNPHSFVWMYVKKADKSGEYDLFAFESDTPNQLKLNGWTRDSLKPGDKVSVRYFPLRDGRPGGRLVMVQGSNGRVLTGAPETFGVAQELQRLQKEKAASAAAPQSGSGK
jgi:hypothetical protein